MGTHRQHSQGAYMSQKHPDFSILAARLLSEASEIHFAAEKFCLILRTVLDGDFMGI